MLNSLLIGFAGHGNIFLIIKGKSSFINTLKTALSGEYVETLARVGKSGTTLTKEISEIPIYKN